MIAIAAAACLAAALGYAALAKAMDLGAARRAAVALGMPKALAPAAVAILLVLELTLAVGLLVESARRTSAGAAEALLVFFSCVVVANLLLRETRPSCNCFGSSSTKPIGARTLARNGSLIVLAFLAGGSGFDEHGPHWDQIILRIAVLAAALLLVALGWLVARVPRRRTRTLTPLQPIDRLRNPGEAPDLLGPALSRHDSGSPMPHAPGRQLPSLTIHSVDGSAQDVMEMLPADRPAVLLFLSEHCASCRSIIETQVPEWHNRQNNGVAVLPLLRGSPATELGLLNWIGPQHLSALGVRGLPAALLVAQNGVVLGKVAYGQKAIVELVEGESSQSLSLG